MIPVLNWRCIRRTLWVITSISTLSCGNEPTASGDQVRERWHHAQSGYGWARPVIRDGLVYFAAGDGFVFGRDAATGAQRWATQIGVEPIWGSNFVESNGVIAVSVVRHTVALDAATGRELWRYLAPLDTVGAGSQPAPGGVAGVTLAVDEDAVYVPAWGASVSAVDLRTGVARWIWQPGPAPTDTGRAGVFRSGAGGVRISGDTVFATVWHNLIRTGGRSESWLVALDRRTGYELWRVVLPVEGQAVSVNGAPAVVGNVVVVNAGMRGEVFAVDRATRQVVWQHVTPERALTPSAQPEAYGDVLYVDGGDSHIYALHATDGSVVWRSPFSGQTSKDMLVTERRVIFSSGAYMYVLDRQTGQRVVELTQPRTDDPYFASPAAYMNGAIFVSLNGAAWSFDEP